MNITPRMQSIRDNVNYIAPSVHYQRRKYDKKYEVVAALSDYEVRELDVNIGGEIVLDVQSDRQSALASVRFFRRQEG